MEYSFIASKERSDSLDEPDVELEEVRGGREFLKSEESLREALGVLSKSSPQAVEVERDEHNRFKEGGFKFQVQHAQNVYESRRTQA